MRWLLIFAFCLPVMAQNWAGILDPLRAVDWSGAGTPILSRTTICFTETTARTRAQINADIQACTPGQTVFLSAGSYSFAGDLIMKSNVTLRGAGANQTLITTTSSGNCQGLPSNICAASSDQNDWQTPSNQAGWSAGYARGATSITLANVTSLTVGDPIILDQTNDTGARPSTGIYICDTDGAADRGCALDGPSGTARTGRAQLEIKTVTSIANNGDGTFAVGISPGLYMPNWSGAKTPQAWWASNPIFGVGIEDLSLTNNVGSRVILYNCSGCWVKGIRSVNSDRSHVWMWDSPRAVVRDSYFYGNQSFATQAYGIEPYPSSDCLFENNILQNISAVITINGPAPGCVIGYNFTINQHYTSPTWQQQSVTLHTVSDFSLSEGNIGAGLYADLFHGTHHFETFFRNRFDGFESNNGNVTSQHTNPIILYPMSRFFNLVGNVLGSTGRPHSIYQITASGAPNDDIAIYTIGYMSSGGGYNDDAYTLTSLLRWGNWDIVTSTNDNGSNDSTGIRFVSGEVPSGISDYPNAVPSSTTIPASFYLSAKPSWFGSIPWPPIGPDVASGNISNVGGHANKIPAEVCYDSMGGPANGTGGVLSFNASSCYASSGGALALMSPSSVTFPDQNVNTTSSVQAVTLSNTGTITMSIASIVISGTNSSEFGMSNGCSATIGVGLNCTINVTFTPATVGAKAANLVVTSNSTNSPTSASLAGNGIIAFSLINGVTLHPGVTVH